MSDVPHCSHGRVLGADDCAESEAWWAEQHAKVDAYTERQWEEARDIVRSVLGIGEKP